MGSEASPGPLVCLACEQKEGDQDKDTACHMPCCVIVTVCKYSMYVCMYVIIYVGSMQYVNLC